MRRVISACAVALCFAAASVSAQDDATLKSKTKIKTDDGKVITATGCLTGGPSSYTLARATPAAVEERVTVGTSGTVVSYTLVPRDGVDLTTHIGQMVEVTGVMVPAATKHDDDAKIKVQEKSKAEVDNAPDAKSKSNTKVEVPRGATSQLAVTSVKMIGATCIAQEP
jgi:hypothetical protein